MGPEDLSDEEQAALLLAGEMTLAAIKSQTGDLRGEADFGALLRPLGTDPDRLGLAIVGLAQLAAKLCRDTYIRTGEEPVDTINRLAGFGSPDGS